MCLDRRWFPFFLFPYNKTNKRWKIVQRHRDNDFFESMFQNHVWRIGVEYEAFGYSHKEHNVGFHVFVERPPLPTYDDEYIIEVEVDEFVASGTWRSALRDEGIRSETWKKAKIVKVFDFEGNDVTQTILDLTESLKAKK